MAVFIAGCGYVGTRVAKYYLARNQAVNVLVRTSNNNPISQLDGVNTIRNDLDDVECAQIIEAQNKKLFYFVPPSVVIDTDVRMTTFLSCLQHNTPRKIIYISTTGVYGDCQGEWITEETAVRPENARSKRRADAERQLIDWCDKRSTQLVILRVAGIYGPGRLPLERLQQALPVLNETESPPSNRIHVEDLVGVCIAAMETALSKFEVFNVADGNPTSMTDYFNEVAVAAGILLPPQISWEMARQKMTPAMLSFLTESKRVNNTKLLTRLNLQLVFPNITAGIESCFAQK